MQQTVDALGHSYSSTNYAATCTEGGYSLAKCSRCGKTERSNETAPLGHSFGEWKTIKNPTTHEPGIQSRCCKVCEKTEEKPIDPITEPPVEQPTDPPEEQPTEPSVEPVDPTEPPAEPTTQPPTQPEPTQPSKPAVDEPATTEPNKTNEPEQANLVPWIIAGSVLLVLTAVGAVWLLRKKS